jgi:hypothetical protein
MELPASFDPEETLRMQHIVAGVDGSFVPFATLTLTRPLGLRA